MSKNFREELQAMDVEQVTKLLGDYLEKLDRVLTDKGMGIAKTFFKASLLNRTEQADTIANVAAQKYGIDVKVTLLNSEAVLKAIAYAAEERGSPFAAKIWQHIELVDASAQIAKAENARRIRSF